MRCAQIDSFPQNPAEPIPAGRPYSMLAHRRTVRDNGLSAVPCIRPLPCLALPCLARPCRAPPSPAMDASASFPPTSCAGGGIRKLLSRVLLRACLGTHVAAQSPFRAFARPAVPSRPVFTSPVSRASFELSGRPLAPPTVSLRPSCRPNRLPPPGVSATFRLVCRACSPSPGVVKICFHTESK